MTKLLQGSILVFIFACLLFSCTTEKKEQAVQEKPVMKNVETQAEVEQLVKDAVAQINEKGKEVFSEFRKEDSKWYYDDTYVFVWGMDGMRYVYPPEPELENVNVKDLEDLENQPIGEQFIKIAESGSGWIEYLWNKPDEVEPARKTTFIMKAVAPDGTEYLVGCGKYDLEIEGEMKLKGETEKTEKM